MGQFDSYLAEDVTAAPALPQELIDRLGDDTTPAPADGTLPAGYVRLPGGIMMPKQTLLILGLAIAVVIVWLMTRKKNKK